MLTVDRGLLSVGGNAKQTFANTSSRLTAAIGVGHLSGALPEAETWGAQRVAPGRLWRRRRTKELSLRAHSTKCYKLLSFLDNELAEMNCDAQDEVTHH